MKVVTRAKSLFAIAVAAAGIVAFAEPEVEITKAWQANPGSGTIDFTYEVRDLDDVGAWAYDVIVRVGAKGCDNTFTFTNENVSVGSVTTNINYKAMLGDVYQNVSIYASLEKRPGGVQLWEGGPYFAECNVGASKPEEYGYYFWWGDTIGYIRNAADNGWVSAKDGTTSFRFGSSHCGTWTLDNAKLTEQGWIDASGNLTAAHDAASAYLGGEWRMPTYAEIQDLVDNCDPQWGVLNNVNGYFIKGKGKYASKSIFLPASGNGYDNRLDVPGSHGHCWSSTPNSSNSQDAWDLGFTSDVFPSATTTTVATDVPCVLSGTQNNELRGF